MSYRAAEIVPGIGMGGVTLGMSVEEVRARLGVPWDTTTTEGVRLYYDCLLAEFDDSNRLVYLVAKLGYIGKIRQCVGIGSKVAGEVDMHGSVFFLVEMGVFCCTGLPGIGFELQYLDRSRPNWWAYEAQGCANGGVYRRSFVRAIVVMPKVEWEKKEYERLHLSSAGE